MQISPEGCKRIHQSRGENSAEECISFCSRFTLLQGTPSLLLLMSLHALGIVEQIICFVETTLKCFFSIFKSVQNTCFRSSSSHQLVMSCHYQANFFQCCPFFYSGKYKKFDNLKFNFKCNFILKFFQAFFP